MIIEELLITLKSKLGYSTTVRDEYLKKIIESVQEDLVTVKGITETQGASTNSLYMLIVDISAWRHDNPQNMSGIPMNLQRRMNDLIIFSKLHPDMPGA
jgi:hypothetical protein